MIMSISCSGVLADAVGYGKTAVTIGLVVCHRYRTLPPIEAPRLNNEPQPRHLIPSRATLIMCPNNLHAQWLQEIHKFTGGKARGYKIIAVTTVTQLKNVTVEDIMTVRIFRSSRHRS
jgi:SNF2 family DNA or RNA helicase